ncbi:type II toxin-antitoxin system VapB family antitoxin [Nocardiopsis chromatogenes]|uniref:type II toxin-antitoxin system VapB family antitoxin n=1 Tax=Nocardiopsis chromatogenes TaxID=280239 RepID=UPI00034CB31B|nr:type II toxin-antitoxin system VapB family antitoxin [Nocardiopsis chromatogenes]
MTRITVDVNDEWLDAAREELGTGTKVATINAALEIFAERRRAREALEAFDEVEMDFEGSSASFGYGGGRDLSRLDEEARTRKAV